MPYAFSRFVLTLPLVATLPLGAAAFPGGSTTPETENPLIPAAMCGRTCADGGRHVSGPPGVCRELGLLYCGPSRDDDRRDRRRDFDRDDDRRRDYDRDRRDDRRRDSDRDFDRRDDRRRDSDRDRPAPRPDERQRVAPAPPAAPATPPSLSVTPTVVPRGGSVAVSWNGGSAAKTCALYMSDATRRNYQPWPSALTGSHPAALTSDTVFSLTCIGAGGAYLPGAVPNVTVRVK